MTETALSLAESFDFSNPYMAAAIIHKGDDTPYPLWTSNEENVAFDIKGRKGAESLKALSFLTELVVELTWAEIPKITATLSPPFEDAIRLLDSNLVEFGTNRIQVQFGYASGVKDKGQFLSPTYEGMLLQPDITMGLDTTIRLNAMGTGSFLAAQTIGGQTIPERSIAEILKTLGDAVNIVLDTDEVKKDPVSSKIFFDDKITFCVANRRYDVVMKELIFQARCTYVDVGPPGDRPEGSKWVVKPRSLFLAKRAPDFVLTMFGPEGNPEGRLGAAVFPIISVGTPPKAVFLPGIQEMILRDIDAKSKKPTELVVGDKDVAVAVTWGSGVIIKGDGIAAPKPNVEGKTGLNPWPGDPGNPTFVQQAHSAFEASSMGGNTMAFPLEVETIGIPSVLPGQVCAIRGLGLRLDGSNYAVQKVVHTLNSSGFTTQLLLINNAGAFIAEELGKAGFGPKNDKKPDTSQGDSKSVEAKPAK